MNFHFAHRGEEEIIGSLSSDVFERRLSTGSEPFSLLISLDATIYILPSVLILIETILPKICSKSRLKGAKRPLLVHMRDSKTLLLKLPNYVPNLNFKTHLFMSRGSHGLLVFCYCFVLF